MKRVQELLARIDELGRQGRDVEMVPVFEELLPLAEQQDPTLLARILNDYGGVLRNTGAYGRAEEILLRARFLVASLLGEDNANFAATLLNEGTNFMESGKLAEAEANFLRAKRICEELNLQDVLYASICNNLGMLYFRQKQLEAAYDLQKQALAILESQGVSRVKMAVSLSNLAQVCKELGRLSEFEELLLRSRDLLAESLGQEHPLYSMALNNLAGFYHEQGNQAEAAALFGQALEIIEKTYGKDSSAYQKAAGNLAQVQNQAATPPEALTTDSNLAHAAGQSGMELSRHYFQTVVQPFLQARYTELLPRLAGGLVGPGSECFGYDDTLSMDHDFEPRMTLWLTKEDYRQFGEQLEDGLDRLPGGKTTVMSIDDFYLNFTKTRTGPETFAQWKEIPEDFLAVAVNGEVFFDYLGTFSAIRQKLLQHYPRDYCLKLLAFHLLKAAQSGQYNYHRSLLREDYVTSRIAEAQFMQHVMTVAHLLNGRYTPFYKWQFRSLESLPEKGAELARYLRQLIGLQDKTQGLQKEALVEEICTCIRSLLRKQGLSELPATFLLDHGLEVASRIADPALRRTNPWAI